jgi:hypothetical protein
MTLGSNYFNRNEYQNLPGGKIRPACKADNLAAICVGGLSRRCGSLDVSQTLWASTACYREEKVACVP